MITEDYCSFEIAKLLKEKGFDLKDGEVALYYNLEGGMEPYSAWVSANPNDYYAMPTHQMAMKWLSIVKGIHIVVKPEFSTEAEPRIDVFIGYSSEIYATEKAVLVEEITLKIEKDYGYVAYESYEEAVEAACLYVLKNLI